ncbi:peptide chain release factor N(5)-glutamine methyltransferase [Notoacmeibacter ruber]|uniref:Release factor glutamine methyltransferase n=1 Tax=Notoacmeibacter ruber TaxID=2670375 RepID=A0A3L7JDM2_9HYPH|nr:peptide chain release factor N(5)-glutamine methyltransferase [Notoacmeibacter ruber]RLQ88570.1 peptide chain release factor N(5)-glutamine methyltransferase [Notoacmeibacter ruber]
MKLQALLTAVRGIISDADIVNAADEARKLVLGTLQLDTAEWISDPNRDVKETACQEVMDRAHARASGVPIHRILGWREFHGLHLALSPDTLEPRNDTEALVELALSALDSIDDHDQAPTVLDLGTGTGAIALALLAEREDLRALGVDLSAGALETAMRNAGTNGLEERFSTVQSNWFSNVRGHFSLIVSNPPYIESRIIGELDEEVRRHDPHLALDGGGDGLDAYRAIAKDAAGYLDPEGAVVVEIGIGQQADVAAIFAARGFDCLETRPDLNGVLRAMLFKTTRKEG